MKLLSIVAVEGINNRGPHRLPRFMRACAAVTRCPRCGGDVGPRLQRGQGNTWCRCPVRRGLALGA